MAKIKTAKSKAKLKPGLTSKAQLLKSRLAELRALMRKRKIAAFVLPRQDEYQGEYVAAYAERLKWLTGFGGSWGAAIIGKTKAAIFVDGRYTIQVREQVDVKNFAPHHLIDEPPANWLKENVKRKEVIAFDPRVTSIADARILAKTAEEIGAKLLALPRNLVDEIWKDQPARPSNPVVAHSTAYAGKPAQRKLKDVQVQLEKQNCVATMLGDPASVNWLFNIRGSDVPYTPLVQCYAIVKTKGRAKLFIDPVRLKPALKADLKSLADILHPKFLDKEIAALGRKGARIALDGSSVPENVNQILQRRKATVVEAKDPCTLPKATKNSVEQEGAREAQLRDGAALSNFLCWLAHDAAGGGVNEMGAAAKLRICREATGKLQDLSFETISASGPNAAIPHYHLTQDSARNLKAGEIFLIDSGGQYLDGTTDVTRTVIVGDPTDEMKDRFTRVLKGMIAISRLRFPKGTTGAHIDVLARESLWRAGFDFDHGTGHGVGSYLSVHEGPQRISKASHVKLEPGMIISNEPGYYKAGHFGIRIENLLLVSEASSIAGGERDMLGFETLTLAPIDRKLIDTSLMTRDELHWLDDYHAQVLLELSPLVEPESRGWLTEACASLR